MKRQMTLVLAPTAAAVRMVSETEKPRRRDGITVVRTALGAAADHLRRHGQHLRLLQSKDRWQLLQSRLQEETESDWPVLSPYLRRAAFVRELACGMDEWNLGLRPGPPELKWQEVIQFADRYDRACADAQVIDHANLIRRAAQAETTSPYDRVIVLDWPEDASAAHELLLRKLTNDGHPEHRRSKAQEDARSAPSLVAVRHPSLEGEAVAGELLTAAASGTAWHDMAVLVRNPQQRGGAIAAALRRHGIPVDHLRVAAAFDEPAVQGLIELMRAAVNHGTGAEAEPFTARSPAVELPLGELDTFLGEVRGLAPSTRPADLAHTIFRKTFPHLVHEPDGQLDDADEHALDALVTFLYDLDDWSDRNPSSTVADYLAMLDSAHDDDATEADVWRQTGTDGVTITSIRSAAGRQWDTVVIAGAVEGELPRIRRTPRLLHLSETEADSTREERALWELAVSRANRMLTAVAAPEPGVLLSRYVEGWATRDPDMPTPVVGQQAELLEETSSTIPIWPDGRLRLSASKLSTWQDCPLKFAYSYALRAKGPGNLWADFGTLVHDVLEHFLHPDHPPEQRTKQRLLDLAQELWTDEVARYRPQREQARRELFEILDLWWEKEGQHHPDVAFVEKEFSVDVGPHTVTGKIDRVTRLRDGSGIEVVDYKTGKTKVSGEAVESDIQLGTYHLAAVRDPELAALGPVQRLRLLYVRDMTDREQPISEDHERRTEAAVLSIAEEMLAEGFDPAVDADCRHCDYHRLCPLQDKGREVPAP